MRTLVEDEFDRVGVYAPRQRGVQPAATNCPCSCPAELGRNLGCKAKCKECQGGGAATQLPAVWDRRAIRCGQQFYSGSNPDLGSLCSNIHKESVAAIAAGKILNPSRTQKISLPAFHTVLRCASPRELWIAAVLTQNFRQNT